MKTRYFVRKLDDGWTIPYYIYSTENGCMTKTIKFNNAYPSPRCAESYETNKSFVEMQEPEFALWLSCLD